MTQHQQPQTFYPDSEDRAASEHAAEFEWLTHVPAPAREPDRPTTVVESVRRAPRSHWLMGVLCGVVLAAVAGIAYVALFIVVGQEVYAAAVVVGLLAGAGFRLGGRAPSPATAFAATVTAALLLVVASALGHAVLDGMVGVAPTGELAVGAMMHPQESILEFLSSPVQAAIAVGLAVAGAIVGSASFERRR